MSGIKSVVLVVVFTFLPSLARGDAEVSCVFMESCILPCSFQSGEDSLIHWYKVTTRDIPVHSYYEKQNQLDHQDQHFQNRTSMFEDQISAGNASLQLTEVKIQDEGIYGCYTSTMTTAAITSFLTVKVDAPVRKVDIQQEENRITCSSEGIYPEPKLTWTTDPPSKVTLQDKTTVHQTEQQLYKISSSVMVSVTDVNYICTVSTRRNKRRATLFKPPSISGSTTDTTIPCTPSNTPLTRLVWRFNHSQIILTRSSDQMGADVPYTVSEQWRQQVKSLSESGSLTLQDLSSDQEGIYTCELSGAEETYVTNTFLMIDVANTRLKIIEDSPNTVVIVGWVVGASVCAGIIALTIFCIKTRGSRRNSTNATPQQEQEQVALNEGAENGGL